MVCEEMQKLRDYLDANHIEYEDGSDCLTKLIIGTYVCRTWFHINGKQWSVINGYGTFGGVDIFTLENKGLLEMMASTVNDGNVIGSLTADEVIKYIAKERNTDGK